MRTCHPGAWRTRTTYVPGRYAPCHTQASDPCRLQDATTRQNCETRVPRGTPKVVPYRICTSTDHPPGQNRTKISPRPPRFGVYSKAWFERHCAAVRRGGAEYTVIHSRESTSRIFGLIDLRGVSDAEAENTTLDEESPRTQARGPHAPLSTLIIIAILLIYS